MKYREIEWRIPFEDDNQRSPSLTCQEKGCPWRYTLASGYFEFREVQLITSDKLL
jgi:hypothetical protein